MRFGMGLVAAACVAAGVAAQQQQQPQQQLPPPTFRSGTQVVSLFVTVTDAQRRLVPSLVQEDFEVRDNDKPQQIVLFENKVLPITVVVMLDTSGSMTGSLALLRDAAEQFIIRLFREDRAKVGAFNDKIEVSGRFS